MNKIFSFALLGLALNVFGMMSPWDIVAQYPLGSCKNPSMIRGINLIPKDLDTMSVAKNLDPSVPVPKRKAKQQIDVAKRRVNREQLYKALAQDGFKDCTIASFCHRPDCFFYKSDKEGTSLEGISKYDQVLERKSDGYILVLIDQSYSAYTVIDRRSITDLDIPKNIYGRLDTYGRFLFTKDNRYAIYGMFNRGLVILADGEFQHENIIKLNQSQLNGYLNWSEDNKPRSNNITLLEQKLQELKKDNKTHGFFDVNMNPDSNQCVIKVLDRIVDYIRASLGSRKLRHPSQGARVSTKELAILEATKYL